MIALFNLFAGPLLETLSMVIFSLLVGLMIGLPVGIILFATNNPLLCPNRYIYGFLNTLTNVFRSFPFIILMILVLPLSRKLLGTSTGTAASVIPLAIAAAPFIARLVENALLEIPYGILEAAIAMGSSKSQILFKVLVPEALPALVNASTLTSINLIGYSAMAGAIGGGGLGDLAIRYGYYRFQTDIMIIAVIIIIVLVQGVQFLGGRLSQKLSENR